MQEQNISPSPQTNKTPKLFITGLLAPQTSYQYIIKNHLKGCLSGWIGIMQIINLQYLTELQNSSF